MENITQVLAVTVLGIAIVFSVLLIIMIVLYLMRFIAPSENTKKEEVIKEVISPANDSTDECELVAVLTAAVAASMKTSTYNLRIKSYKRLS